MFSSAVEETAPPRRPVPIPRFGLVAGAVLAVCAGSVLGAMAGSLATGTEQPLPPRPEVLAIAENVWNEREPEPASPEETANLDSQTEHEDVGGMPGWSQILLGDTTADRPAEVYWPGPPGWSEDGSNENRPETLPDNARRLDEAAANLAASGWEVTRPYPTSVHGRRGTLRVEFHAYELETPLLEVYRLPPPSHPWLTGAGALLGALAAVGAVAAFVRHRRTHPPHGLTALGINGLGLLTVNFAVAVGIVWNQWRYDEGFDNPLWRGARFLPFGLAMNTGLVMVAIAACALWRQRSTRAARNAPDR